MNPNYQTFFDNNANPSAVDPYEAMGYKAPFNAQLRYNAMLDQLKKQDTSGKVVVDAGAGTGTMWTHYLETRLDELKALNLHSVILVDNCGPTMGYLRDACNRLNDAGITAVVIEKDFTTDLPEGDIVVAVGALNYYSFDQFADILKNFEKQARQAFIFESNVQTPHTSTDGGTWNPSFEVIYQLLYSRFLSDGKSRVNVECFKKWTSIWAVTKGQ